MRFSIKSSKFNRQVAMKKLTLTLLALLSLSACAANPGGSGQLGDACGELGWGRIGGTLVGAAGGAFLGSQIGGGNTARTISTALGTLAGGGAGLYAGNSIDKGQCEQAKLARTQALDHGRIGQSISWNQGNASGVFTPIREGRDTSGSVCKEYTQTLYINGKPETGTGTACRRADGRWQLA